MCQKFVYAPKVMSQSAGGVASPLSLRHTSLTDFRCLSTQNRKKKLRNRGKKEAAANKYNNKNNVRQKSDLGHCSLQLTPQPMQFRLPLDVGEFRPRKTFCQLGHGEWQRDDNNWATYLHTCRSLLHTIGLINKHLTY